VKKFNIEWSTFTLLFLLVGSVVGAADLKSGLIGSWRFDASDGTTVNDGSGNDNHGRISSGTIAGSPQALRCNGFSTEVEIAEKHQVPARSALTFLAWVRPSAVTKRIIVGKPHTDPGFATPMPGLYFTDRGVLAFGGWQANGKNKGVYEGTTEISRDVWVMVAATYGTSSVTLYVNGQPDGHHQAFPEMQYNSGPLYIGRAKVGSSMFKGLIGEVRMYDRALNGEEIAEFYQQTRSSYPQEVAKPKSPGRTIPVSAKVSPSSKAWVEYPTRTLDLLDGYQSSGTSVKLDEYGGWLGHQEKATGYFYPKKIGTRWWLIDPAGNYFIHMAVVAISAGNSKTVKENFPKMFSSKQNWADVTTTLLQDNGFNGAGAWSDTKDVRGAKKPVAYTIIKNFAADFARTKGLSRASVGHSGFLHDSIPVFNPDFPAFCEAKARDLADTKNDPWLLGIFSDNELLVPVLDNYLKFDMNDPVQAPNYVAAKAWLKERKGKTQVSEKDITPQDRAEFMGYVFDTYFKIASGAIRRADPNHMYIGSRFHSREKENPYVWKAAGKYCEIISVNYYFAWSPDLGDMREWTEWSGKPVIITEWYAKGDDVGFPNTTGAGWLVKTQRDRGLFYQNYVLGCIEAGNCVGWHWFKYMDNDMNDPKADPSNRDANKGIVRVNYSPYQEVLKLMKPLNREAYPLTQFFDKGR
jgi:hypothetical protein